MRPLTIELLRLRGDDADPVLTSDRGVAPIAAAERQLHRPDARLLALAGGSLVARCSCWWQATAVLAGRRIGAIGHYAAADAAVGQALLSSACALLASEGVSLAVGPMDGSTWRRYRCVVERGGEPPFFLEPDNPADWPAHWSAAGFRTLARYTSAVAPDLTRRDPRALAARPELDRRGIALRPLDLGRAEAELRGIFALSLTAFAGNFLYTPVDEDEFLAQNRALLPYVRPELVLLAEAHERLVGFLFALPDAYEQRRTGRASTVILKTLAVEPDFRKLGLGGVLMDEAQRQAAALGCTRAIHALMYEQNASRRISDRYARTIRRYALFVRELRP